MIYYHIWTYNPRFYSHRHRHRRKAEAAWLDAVAAKLHHDDMANDVAYDVADDVAYGRGYLHQLEREVMINYHIWT